MIELLNRAEEDYKICKQLEPCLPDEFAVRGCVYHIQQANEKVLKAYLCVNGIQPPFSHDIGRLVGMAEQENLEIPMETRRVANTLTLWESKSRYDPYIYFSKDEYDFAKFSYEKICKMIKTQTSDYLSEDNIDLTGNNNRSL